MNDDCALSDAQRDEDVGDSLLADLGPNAVVEPYLVPNNSRRRIPAVLYLLIGAVCVLAALTVGADTPLVNDAFVNNGVLVAGIVLIVVGRSTTPSPRSQKTSACRRDCFDRGGPVSRPGWLGSVLWRGAGVAGSRTRCRVPGWPRICPAWLAGPAQQACLAGAALQQRTPANTAGTGAGRRHQRRDHRQIRRKQPRRLDQPPTLSIGENPYTPPGVAQRQAITPIAHPQAQLPAPSR